MPIAIVITFCVLELMAVVITASNYQKLSRKKQKYRETAEGAVISHEEMTADDGNKIYRPSYEYYVKGRCYQMEAGTAAIDAPGISEKITVMYDPEIPEHSYIRDFEDKEERRTTLFAGSCTAIILLIFIALWMIWK